jgi:predicted flap endonuclease-1-like 5' DNA nuclease
MKNKNITAFWIGFLSTIGLVAWVYWMWRQKRVVAPEPLVVAGRHRSRAVRVPPAPAVERSSSPISDALEEIRGIGPVFANRLNEAGIFTYSQLASSSPDELARITEVKRWDPEDWIAEAAALAAA